jgi:hypothetical protein
VLEQKSYSIVNGSSLDQMVVVEDEHDVLPHRRGYLVDERRQDRFYRWRFRRMERIEYAPAEAFSQRAEGGHQISQEAPQVVIPLVQ